jgi:hypothetical protein
MQSSLTVFTTRPAATAPNAFLFKQQQRVLYKIPDFFLISSSSRIFASPFLPHSLCPPPPTLRKLVASPRTAYTQTDSHVKTITPKTATMSVVSLLGVNVLNNPAKFSDAYQFEITFECLEPLEKGTAAHHPALTARRWLTCCRS